VAKLTEERDALSGQLQEATEKKVAEDLLWQKRFDEENDRFKAESGKSSALAKEIQKSTSKWTTALSAILTSSIAREDISSKLLEPMLSEGFRSIREFDDDEFDQDFGNYSFASSFTGLPTIAGGSHRLTVLDLLAWWKGIPITSDCPQDEIQQVVWLEQGLLQDIRTRAKKDVWVLLAFESMLDKATSTKNWMAKCMLYVMLASLATQYKMVDGELWLSKIRLLKQQHAQLDIDPLGQACLAHLALTTQTPAACIHTALLTAYEQKKFDSATPIAEIVGLIEDNHDNMVVTNVGGTNVVITRFNDEEVVFSKSLDSEWICSFDRIEVIGYGKPRTDLKWGPATGQTVELDLDIRNKDPLYRYFYRYHGLTTLASARKVFLDEREKELEAKNAEVLIDPFIDSDEEL
jgi:hypothetical protein